MQAGLDPSSVQAEVHALLAEDRLDEAEAAARRAVAATGGHVGLVAMLARLTRAQGNVQEALTLQEKLVERLPGDYVLRFDLAESLLLTGNFERGWREYEHRYRLPNTVRLERKVQKPRWDGTPLDGRAILIHDEQGYGDTFQFIRFVHRVKARGGTVLLQVNHDTYPFARRMTGYDHLFRRGELPPRFDTHCEMMSLPWTLGLTLEDLPAIDLPYLSADPARVARWRRRLHGLRRPLVALVWAGRPTHLNDRNRSMPLGLLAPLAGLDASFVAIQKGPRAADILTAPPGLRLIGLDAEIRDFEDTAAILSVVDLLVSVDSAPVHLAGALGRPAWVMLPFVPDWRWLTAREDTPWYPGMRLFRQARRGDWSEVVARVAEAVRALRPEARRA